MRKRIAIIVALCVALTTPAAAVAAEHQSAPPVDVLLRHPKAPAAPAFLRQPMPTKGTVRVHPKLRRRCVHYRLFSHVPTVRCRPLPVKTFVPDPSYHDIRRHLGR